MAVTGGSGDRVVCSFGRGGSGEGMLAVCVFK